MKKILFLLVASLFMAHCIQAQVSFGIRAGFNFTDISVKYDGVTETSTSIPGFQAGFVTDFALSNSFSIQPAIMYATQGGQTKEDGIPITMAINYAQIPINAQYKFDVGGNAKLFLQAGPYVGYALNGKLKIKEGGITTSEKIDFDEWEMSRLDYGVGVGAGLQFGSFQLSLGYNQGLADLNKDIDGVVKNSGFAVTLTYLFGK